MKKTVVLSLLLCLGLLSVKAQQQDRFPFETTPDEFKSDALLDLRGLNEAEAGEHGFIQVDEHGDFLRGDGEPIRFWAVGTEVGREKPWQARPLGRKTEPDLNRHARFLAKHGVNMVRCHAHINPTSSAADLNSANEADIDWIWRVVAGMKKQGIYTTISPYWGVQMALNPAWGITAADGANNCLTLLFFDEKLQNAYRNWMRLLLAVPNPYTGIPLAKDPAVAILSLQNEDSLLFWTVDQLKGSQRLALGKKYSDWLKQKYVTLDTARQSWSGITLPGDDPANGIMDFYIIWEETQKQSGGKAKRLADQLEFWTQTMREFNHSMAAYLHDTLGCGQIINAGNWKTADTVYLEDCERYSYTSTDVVAVNRYFGGVHKSAGGTEGWAIVNGDQFTSPSILQDPRDFPLNLKQVKGSPLIITESAWVMPNGHASEAPFLIAAYQSLTGIDAYYWFSTGDDEFTAPQSANGYMPSQAKWIFGTPDMLGNFPAAALLYRKGYVKKGEPVVHEVRALQDMWDRKTPIIAESPSFDPNRDAGDIAQGSSVQPGVDPAAFLMGPVEVMFNGNPAESSTANWNALLSGDKKTIRSITGEITLNTTKAYCTVDSPRAQGVAAFFKNQGQFNLSDIQVNSTNEYGAVLVVSMDERALKVSSKILVQVGTSSRPTGWSEETARIQMDAGTTIDGFKVLSFGQAPWAVVKPALTMEVRNPGINHVIALDFNGNASRDLEFERTGEGVRFQFPEDRLYVVLQAPAVRMVSPPRPTLRKR
jgi:hypothetical protein